MIIFPDKVTNSFSDHKRNPLNNEIIIGKMKNFLGIAIAFIKYYLSN